MILNGTRKLAVDRSCLISARGVVEHVESAEKCKDNPVILPDQPWEQDVHVYGSVIKVDGIYKMWYMARCREYAIRSVCYAESADGIHWTKPALDVVEYEGQKTNIVFGTLVTGKCFNESDTVLYTPWDKGKEYKMIFLAHTSGEYAVIAAQKQVALLNAQAEKYAECGDYQMERKMRARIERKLAMNLPSNLVAATVDKVKTASALHVAWSSDGIHWSYNEEPSCYEVEDISHMFFDPKTREYMLYGRVYAYDADRVEMDRNLPQFDGCAGRAIGLARSRDGIHFGKTELVYNSDYRDRPGDEIYSMSVFPWQGVYLALVQMYHGAPNDMTQDIQLAISRDAVHFSRVGDRNPIIPLGGIGEWDRFNTCMADEPVVENDTVRLYFNGALFRHPQVFGGAGFDQNKDTWKRLTYIGFGELAVDRFACAMASFDGGVLETVPMTLAGDTLLLNCVSRFGELIVRFTGMDSGNSSEIVVSEDGLRVKAAIPEWARREEITLAFTLKNAKLYSYCAVSGAEA